MTSGEAHRAAWQSLRAATLDAEAGGDCAAIERAHAELDLFVARLVTDARRLRAIAAVSPDTAEAIRLHAAGMELPPKVLDPAYDPSFARLWAASLGDAELAMLRLVIAAEARRRDTAASPAPARNRHDEQSRTRQFATTA